MKTEKEINNKLKWLINAINDSDNQTEAQQIKLHAQIDFIKWLEIEKIEDKNLNQAEKNIKTYQVLCDYKNREIELLKFKLENFESIQRGKCCECERNAIQELSSLMIKIMPFSDEYFKNLDYEQIAELAKKSIRLTAENSKLLAILEEIYEKGKLTKEIKLKIEKYVRFEL